MPAKKRKRAHVNPSDVVKLEVEGDGFRLMLGDFTLATSRGSVPALDPPMTYEEMERRVKEDRVMHLIAELEEQKSSPTSDPQPPDDPST